MEEYNLDEVAAEFETDTEILNMIDSIKMHKGILK